MPLLVYLNNTALAAGDIIAVRDPRSVAALFIYSRSCAYIAVNLCILYKQRFCSVCVQVNILQPSIITFISMLHSHLGPEHKGKEARLTMD